MAKDDLLTKEEILRFAYDGVLRQYFKCYNECGEDAEITKKYDEILTWLNHKAHIERLRALAERGVL